MNENKNTSLPNNNEIHIWQISLPVSPSYSSNLASTLDEREIERAGRYHSNTDRIRFVVTRGLLRKILSAYTDQHPEEFCIVQNCTFCGQSHGKPRLLLESNPDRLNFSISHSLDLIVYAFAVRQDVGIDIEYVRSGVPYMEIAQLVFTPKEIKAIENLPHEQALRQFYCFWTRKEALSKMTGEGLAMAMKSIDVAIISRGVPSLEYGQTANALLKTARIWDLHLPKGYVGALASSPSYTNLKFLHRSIYDLL